MNASTGGDGVSLSRRQGLGCLGLAAFSLAAAVLCVVLGARCLLKNELFDCIGLLTVFPLAFLVAALASGAVGLQRFTTGGQAVQAQSPPPGLAGAWQTAQPIPRPRPRTELPPVIHLPGASSTDTHSPRDGESEQA